MSGPLNNKAKNCPIRLRRIGYKDVNTGIHYIFLTNNFTLAARTIADIYKARWQIELFFKWFKQNLKVKSFLGTSKNAVMTQMVESRPPETKTTALFCRVHALSAVSIGVVARAGRARAQRPGASPQSNLCNWSCRRRRRRSIRIHSASCPWLGETGGRPGP